MSVRTETFILSECVHVSTDDLLEQVSFPEAHSLALLSFKFQIDTGEERPSRRLYFVPNSLFSRYLNLSRVVISKSIY